MKLLKCFTLLSLFSLSSLACQEEPSGLTYADAGVVINTADRLVETIKPYCRATKRPGWDSDLGGYGTLFDLNKAGHWKEPILVSGTDGVGTKLLLAHQANIHDTVGIDLVAMSVNDILTRGAEPLFFLDYYASGKLQVEAAASVIRGIAEGSKLAGCALMGGETAQMPQMYDNGKYDLAGFAVGVVEKEKILPRIVLEGDLLIGVPSSGLHSNGFSLVRKIVSLQNLELTNKPPFASEKNSLAEALLEPTRIYVKDLKESLDNNWIEAMAHITGSGMMGNLPRIFSNDLVATLDASTWEPAPIFQWIAKAGPVSQSEMLNTFNCGVGMILIVREANTKQVLASVPGSFLMGKMAKKPDGNTPSVLVQGLLF